MRLLAVLTTLLLAAGANAENLQPCYLDAQVSGKSFHILVGGMKLQGYGEIICYDNQSDEWVTEKMVQIEGKSVGFGAGISKFKDARLFSGGPGLIEGPATLLGDYIFVKTGVQAGPVGVDGGVSVLFKAQRDKGVAIPFALNLKKGKGLELSLLDVVKISVTEIEQ